MISYKVSVIFTSLLLALLAQRFILVTIVPYYHIPYFSVHVVQDDGTLLTLSIDANFGLCRKRSAGKSVSGPRTKNKMFIDQTEVDSFVQSYSSHSKPTNMEKVSYENVCIIMCK